MKEFSPPPLYTLPMSLWANKAWFGLSPILPKSFILKKLSEDASSPPGILTPFGKQIGLESGPGEDGMESLLNSLGCLIRSPERILLARLGSFESLPLLSMRRCFGACRDFSPRFYVYSGDFKASEGRYGLRLMNCENCLG